MPGPKLECGTIHTPPCPPENAALIQGGVKYYTEEQMREHGHASYHKGRKDVTDIVNEVLERPGPGWGGGELAAALRRALGE